MKQQYIFIKKLIAMALTVLLSISTIINIGVVSHAELINMSERELSVNGAEPVKVHVISYSYENNVYISARDAAIALKDSGSQFDFSLDSSSITLTTNSNYKGYVPDEDTIPWTEDYLKEKNVTLKSNDIEIDGEKRKYYTIIASDANGNLDCFFSLADLSMIINAYIDIDSKRIINIDTEIQFNIDPEKMEQDGFFQGINSVLVGDATSNRIWYEYSGDVPYPIASTSKLMTYLIVMDKISAGELSMEDVATFSKESEILSKTADGTMPIKEGDEANIEELLTAMLLKSSNECAQTLAEKISGNEESFSKLMTEKAKEIGMTSAIFYNSNGLPVYTDSLAAAKKQNRMSAEDMFKLVSYIMRVYPQITDITSQKSVYLNCIDQKIDNTVSLLYNIKEATGLKTGTTNKAGCCLVTSLKIDDHDLIVVLYGAETSVERARTSELLARYAIQKYKGVKISAGDEEEEEAAATAEDIVQKVLKLAKSKASE